MTGTLIVTRGVEKSYPYKGGRTWVLRRIDLEVRPGDFVTVMGPSGSRQARVAEILDRFQIVARKDLFPPQLSGGQQQQVAVARAVIADPGLILADEPTGSLHWSQGERIMELLRGLNEAGTTIVQVTHDERVAGYGNRVIHLADGWIVRPEAASPGAAGPAREVPEPS